jgi:hypothetical protein
MIVFEKPGKQNTEATLETAYDEVIGGAPIDDGRVSSKLAPEPEGPTEPADDADSGASRPQMFREQVVDRYDKYAKAAREGGIRGLRRQLRESKTLGEFVQRARRRDGR